MNRNNAREVMELMKEFPINAAVVWNISDQLCVGTVIGYRTRLGDTGINILVTRLDGQILQLNPLSPSYNLRKEV